tara:strand:- start:12595 stop:13368 length:774 start_codon:yes stop_codon:yes gene_type:complete
LLVKLHNIFANNKMDIKVRRIYDASMAIIRELEKKYEINLDVSNVKELSTSSLKQQNNGIISSRRRVNSPGSAKSIIEGHDETTIRENLTKLFDISNPIIKLKNLAILLEELNDFDSDYIHIYRILVWISLCILIDSKTKVLKDYKHSIHFSLDNSVNKQKVITYLQNKKPFYRIIDYNQLLFLYKEYNSILKLQNMKMRRGSTNIKEAQDFIINGTVVIPTNTSMALGLIGIKDTRMYGKIQKAIKKLRAKDTTKK